MCVALKTAFSHSSLFTKPLFSISSVLKTPNHVLQFLKEILCSKRSVPKFQNGSNFSSQGYILLRNLEIWFTRVPNSTVVHSQVLCSFFLVIHLPKCKLGAHFRTGLGSSKPVKLMLLLNLVHDKYYDKDVNEILVGHFRVDKLSRLSSFAN